MPDQSLTGWPPLWGLRDGRPAMEKRIKGMFGITRTGVKGRITAVCIAVIMLAGVFMTACQPTPEKPFVQSKASDAVERAITSSAPGNSAKADKFSAPATWQSSVKDEAKKIEINVNARVSVPTDTWGLYELIPQSVDRAYLDAVLKALIGDSQIYGEDTYRSREELEADLVRLKGQLEKAKNMQPAGKDEKNSDEDPGKNVQMQMVDVAAELEKRIADIEKAIINAPDTKTVQKVPIDLGILFSDNPNVPEINREGLEFGVSSVEINRDNGGIYIKGLADTGKEEPAQITLYKSPGGGINVEVRNVGAGNTASYAPLLCQGIRTPYRSQPAGQYSQPLPSRA